MSNKLPDFSGKKILVIGDIMLDQYIYGSVDRISPEAPVPVLLRDNTSRKAGGAANVALNIKTLGADPILLGVLGNDLSGSKLIEVLEDLKIDTEFVLRADGVMTTVKTRLLAGTQHLLRIDEEDISPLNEVLEASIINLLTEIIDKYSIDALIVEDYDKGLMSEKLIKHIADLGRQKQVFLSVDPKFKNFLSYEGFDLVKPNLKEVNQVLNKKYKAELEDLEKAAAELQPQMNYKNLMITLGEQGIFGVNYSGNLQEPAQKMNNLSAINHFNYLVTNIFSKIWFIGKTYIDEKEFHFMENS